MLLSKLKISGHSMSPALKEGDIIVISNIPYVFKKPKIGDIVGFKLGEKIFLKRIKFVVNEKYFVEGDNEKDSMDSKKFGLIKEKQIIGKFIYRL